MRAAWLIALRDLRECRRDGRLLGAAVSLVLILVLAVLGSAARWRHDTVEQADAQRAERERWLSQGDVNPHAAAHYGTFVFAPREPLALVDPGVTPFVGAAVFLEAHQQQLARYRPTEAAAPIRRLTAVSVATCLQLLVPLFLVVTAAGLVARDRERGTWRLLQASGVGATTLAAGRLLGLAMPVVVGVVAALGAVLTALLIVAPGGVDADALRRGGTLVGVYAAYLATWGLLGLAMAMRARSVREAMSMAVAAWLVLCLVGPVAVATAVTVAAPAPTATAFDMAIERAREALPSWEARVAAATDRFLNGEDLPPASNPEVVALIDTEAADTEIYRRELDALGAILAEQTRLFRTWAVVSPTTAVQVLSMALAGTDDDHHRDFVAAASDYRTALLRALNQDLAAFDAWKTFSATGSRESWARVPEFTYDTPTIGWALARVHAAAAGLAAWGVVAFGALWAAVRRDRRPS